MSPSPAEIDVQKSNNVASDIRRTYVRRTPRKNKENALSEKKKRGSDTHPYCFALVVKGLANRFSPLSRSQHYPSERVALPGERQVRIFSHLLTLANGPSLDPFPISARSRIL